MLRSLGLLAVVFGLLPLAFMSPFVGVLQWTWVSIMSPQEFVWDMLAGLRWGVYIGAATVVTWVFSRDSKSIPMTATTVLMILLTIWMTITTSFALVPEAAWSKWDYVFRVMVQVIIT